MLIAVQASGAFDVRLGRLLAGDYLIDDEVLIERKTVGDFAASLVDEETTEQLSEDEAKDLVSTRRRASRCP